MIYNGKVIILLQDMYGGEVLIDRFNRKINYARISLTNMCNLKCSYCSQGESNNEHIPIEFYKNLIDVLDNLRIEKIRFTGGEPLLNKNIVKLVKYASSKKGIKDIAITTNGVLLHKYINELIESGLTRINLSLDSRNKDVYNSITGFDKLNNVMENFLLAKEKGIKVKVNAVLLKNITDAEIEDFLDFGFENDVQIRFIELMPIGDNLEYFNKHYLSSEEILSKLDCVKVEKDDNSVASYYKYKNKYEFGVITPISNHFCNSCNRIRITSKCTLRLCLHSDTEIDLLKYKDDKQRLKEVVGASIGYKPEKHEICEQNFAKSSMVQIGG